MGGGDIYPGEITGGEIIFTQEGEDTKLNVHPGLSNEEVAKEWKEKYGAILMDRKDLRLLGFNDDGYDGIDFPGIAVTLCLTVIAYKFIFGE